MTIKNQLSGISSSNYFFQTIDKKSNIFQTENFTVEKVDFGVSFLDILVFRIYWGNGQGKPIYKLLLFDTVDNLINQNAYVSFLPWLSPFRSFPFW